MFLKILYKSINNFGIPNSQKNHSNTCAISFQTPVYALIFGNSSLKRIIRFITSKVKKVSAVLDVPLGIIRCNQVRIPETKKIPWLKNLKQMTDDARTSKTKTALVIGAHNISSKQTQDVAVSCFCRSGSGS